MRERQTNGHFSRKLDSERLASSLVCGSRGLGHRLCHRPSGPVRSRLFRPLPRDAHSLSHHRLADPIRLVVRPGMGARTGIEETVLTHGGEKGVELPLEILGALDLRPMTDATEDEQIRIREQLHHPQAGLLERNNAVVHTVNDQCRHLY